MIYIKLNKTEIGESKKNKLMNEHLTK